MGMFPGLPGIMPSPPGMPGSKKGDAPPPPDYRGAAEQTGMQNRPNQRTPFGSTSWTTGPDGRPMQTTAFDPALQGTADSMMGQAGSAWKNPLDNGQQARQHAEDAIYQRSTSRLDPMFGQREHDLQTQLANQGIDPSSQAYSTAQDNFGRSRNDAYQTALNESIMGGGAEASRQQQMDLASRFAPLQGLGSLRSLLQMPGFGPGADFLRAAGMQGGYGLEANQQNNQSQSDYWSALAQLAGAAMKGAK